ncbi:hypothetical protein JAAARDRAFT_36119 [Jaapia argillacea MUCL 33604]|uniref:Uncharacterized protein n=1 Tax=Jaapia argillacea MUCL 33604 TaxID=933084 RepID=A0A067Q209_9AGAM|nr:hypothetical protein JAAARDRAFT_36119 [Jaapia argillacea MUCL 33604]
MSLDAVLNDANQTAVYIPFEAPGDDNEDDSRPELSNPPYEDRDLPDGFNLRLESYRAAWQKCLVRIQSILHALHSPLASEIVHEVDDAYFNVLPDLPYPEIPTIAVYCPPGGSSLLNDVTRVLDPSRNRRDGDDMDVDAESDDEHRRHAFIGHLYPPECSSITSTMKSLVTQFVDRSPDGLDEQIKRKPSTSLANFDINLVEAWWRAVKNAHAGQIPPQLAIILHDFEQFDPSIIQDLMYILSLHISRLPFILILSLSSPPTPSYLHATYPRSTLALLRIRNFIVPSGPRILEEVFLKTFFDLEFEPDVMIGPSTIEHIAEYFFRFNPSLDAVLTILQLTYLKHFDEPLAVFIHDSLLGTPSLDEAYTKLAQPSSLKFLESLLARHSHTPPSPPLPTPSKSPTKSKSRSPPLTLHASANEWAAQTIPSLLTSLDSYRETFKSRARDVRIGFAVFRVVRGFLLELGYKLDIGKGKERVGFEFESEMMIKALRGRFGREGRALSGIVQNLPSDHLDSLLASLSKFFESLAPHIYEKEKPAIEQVAAWVSSLSCESGPSSAPTITGEFSEWLSAYLEEHIRNLEDCKLCDVWYTGSTPFPFELINPAPRISIISALLHPDDYLDELDPTAASSTNGAVNGVNTAQNERPQPELPDTTLLFKRYSEGGKMINVFDWFESFALELENRKEQTNGKSKANGVTLVEYASAEEVQTDVEIEEEEGEKWRMGVQARFIRALHELDYLGFIKHTNRKPDHILKTVFDLAG